MSDNAYRLYPPLTFLGVENKDRNRDTYIRGMLARTLRMFEYEGLPDTIPARQLELMLQTGVPGAAIIARVDDTDGGGLWAFPWHPGGKPNRYLMPTMAVVANPTLKRGYNFEVYHDDPSEDTAVVIRNDSMYLGTLPSTYRAAEQLAENDISMLLVDITSRMQSIIAASDDNTRGSAEKYLKQLRDGRLGVVMADTELIESLKTHPMSQHTGALTDLIEYHQYIKASWFNEMGLNANYNMKREAINSQEAQMGDDALVPYVEDMLKCREEGIERVNEMFGTNIRVRLSRAWESSISDVLSEGGAEDVGDTEYDIEPVTNMEE